MACNRGKWYHSQVMMRLEAKVFVLFLLTACAPDSVHVVEPTLTPAPIEDYCSLSGELFPTPTATKPIPVGFNGFEVVSGGNYICIYPDGTKIGPIQSSFVSLQARPNPYADCRPFKDIQKHWMLVDGSCRILSSSLISPSRPTRTPTPFLIR